MKYKFIQPQHPPINLAESDVLDVLGETDVYIFIKVSDKLLKNCMRAENSMSGESYLVISNCPHNRLALRECGYEVLKKA